MKNFIVGLVVLFLGTSYSFAEFSVQEKNKVIRMRSVCDSARYIMFYAGDELKQNQNSNVWPLAINVALKAYDVQYECQFAINNLIGSLSTDIPENNPLTVALTPEHRVSQAQFYWNRAVGGYLNGQLQVALDNLKANGAITAGILVYSDRNHMSNINSAYEDVVIQEGTFVSRETAQYPFLVRRTSDNVGVHGHFEVSTEEEAQGIGYLMASQREMLEGLQQWDVALPQTVRTAARGMLLSFKDLMIRTGEVQLSTFGILGSAEQFSRLLEANRDALIGVGLALRTQGMGALKTILQNAMSSGQVAASDDLAEALEKFADGWGLAVDKWTWDSIRFPCISGYESVGCQQGNPVEALLP